MRTQRNIHQTHALSITIAVMANIFLGVSSLYWRQLADVSPITLVAYRIGLSTAILAVLIFSFRQLNQVKHYTVKLIILHCSASVLIAINWGAFIWSSMNGYIFESGLGYLLAPALSILLGLTIYREPLSTGKIIATLLALLTASTLIILTKNLNHFTYLTIAITWGCYTYIKKFTSLNAVNGLFIETLFLTSGLAFTALLFDLSIAPPNKLLGGWNPLIWLAGFVSTVPLLMFSYTTGKIPLSLTGLLQFTLPLTLIMIALIFN